jgi:hypothetical protein
MTTTQAQYISELKRRRNILQQKYGKKGERHPSARMIGGLNPVAQEIMFLTGKINSFKRPDPFTIKSLVDGVTPRSKRTPAGLLFQVTMTGKTNIVSIGKTHSNAVLHNPYYVVGFDGDITGEFATIGAALKSAKEQLTQEW